jgi:quercetin dioxygenase-like cupin family protein
MKVSPLTAHAQEDVRMEGADRVRMRMLIGPAEGAPNFNMRHFEVQPGGCTPHHQHDYEHEVLILQGQGLARSEQGNHPVKAGDVVWVPPNEMHQFQNTGTAPLEFLCLVPVPKGAPT